ncbi:MAG: hypothetical protein HQK77_14240 [Desulfobacterales bacterium]|nr:hypothetical protein [Desulfobacterales bacterium]
MKEYFKKYIDYITNTGGSPTIQQFDEDWEPIGEMVRRDMEFDGLTECKDDKIYLKGKP